MSALAPTGTIATFYSWKGGVGRTMALANIAVQLSRMGSSVLMVDWDLEAPGLDRYFLNSDIKKESGLVAKLADDQSGLMGLLHQAFSRADAQIKLADWKNRLINIEVPRSEPTSGEPTPPTPNRLDLLSSGHGRDDYAARLAAFSWSNFFTEARGGEWLESIRGQWADSYDFVLIDSRTGLTDSGGVCTVQMPHVLVLVFTANEQSVDGGLRIVAAAQKERSEFAYDRGPLAVIPILSRWEGEKEVDIGERWMRRFDLDLAPLTAPWLPKDFSPRQFLDKTRIPHVARFSFGEPLPVLTHSITDPGLPGLYFNTIARLMRSKFVDAGTIIDPSYRLSQIDNSVGRESEAELLNLVLDQAKLHKEIARVANVYGAGSIELVQFLNRAGLALRRVARFDEAQPLLRRAVDIIGNAGLVEGQAFTASLTNLAHVLLDTNRFSEAEPLIRRALAADEKSFGPDHPYVAADLNNLAHLLKATNRLDEAEPLIRRSLAIHEKALGPDDPKVATNLNNLAQLLQATSRFAEAEPLLRRALAIDEKSFGPDHPEVATDLNNLAQLLQDTDRVIEAEALLRRALAIDEKSFGPDHPAVAAGLNNLAQLLQDTDRLIEAEPLMRRALAIDEKSYGPDHPEVARNLNNLAGLLQRTQRFDEAEPLLRNALTIDEKSFGPDHPTVAIRLNNLAGLLRDTNRLIEAEPLMRRHVAIFVEFTRRTGHRHPRLEDAFGNYASLLAAVGKSQAEIDAACAELMKPLSDSPTLALRTTAGTSPRKRRPRKRGIRKP